VVERGRLEQGGRALLRGVELSDVRAFYEAGYTEPDAAEAERLGRWRALGARSKAAHARALCARGGLTPASLAEIGCGNGALLAELAGLAPVRDGFELSEMAVALARREVPDARRIERFDGLHVPAADGEYDLVILSHVLEHVPDPAPLLGEAARVGRHVLIEVPLEANRSAARPAKRAEMAEIGHLHALSRARVLDLLAGAGLRPEAELTDPLGREHHAFFAASTGARRAATVKWAVRAALHGAAPGVARRLFTLHYAVLASRP
jgi:SAM-dependent methyltransferase